MKKLLKGMFFNEIIEQVEDKLSKKAVIKLQEEFGEPLDFSNFKDYPVEKHLKLLNIASLMLFGEDKNNAYFQMGRLSWKTFAESMVGKTVIALYAHDAKKATLAISKLWGTITNFGIRETEDLGERLVKISVKEDPRPPEYIEGVLAGAIEYFHSQPDITTTVLGVENYEFRLAWSVPS
jgi:uncharacterized protein (TIGR02265 family)